MEIVVVLVYCLFSRVIPSERLRHPLSPHLIPLPPPALPPFFFFFFFLFLLFSISFLSVNKQYKLLGCVVHRSFGRDTIQHAQTGRPRNGHEVSLVTAKDASVAICTHLDGEVIMDIGSDY